MAQIDFERKSRQMLEDYQLMLKRLNADKTEGLVEDRSDMSRFCYIKLKELCRLDENEDVTLHGLMQEIFTALHALGVIVSVVFLRKNGILSVFAGADEKYIEDVRNAFNGILPLVGFETEKNRFGAIHEKIYPSSVVLFSEKWSDGGFLKGNPAPSEGSVRLGLIEKVIKGMGKNDWIVSVFASPVPKTDTIAKKHLWLTRATDCSQLSELSYMGNDMSVTTTYKKTYFHSEQYYQKILAFCEKGEESISVGEWCVNVNFASEGIKNARLLGGLLCAAYNSEKSQPESMHYMLQPQSSFCHLFNPMKYAHNDFCDYPYPVYGNYLTSRELGVVCCPPLTDTAGVTVRPFVSFDVNREKSGDTVIGKIIENGEISENKYSVDINELNRHCLVIGLTGSGKTNTVKSLICSTAKREKGAVPFMIIEPAKKEYWELYKLGFDSLRIYSIGSNESFARRLCINPFERVSFKDEYGNKRAVSLQTHIDFVFSAFKASFIMYTPMPYVLEKAIYAIYEDCGWDIANNINRNGSEIYPTIEDLYFKLPVIIEEMGYDAKMRNDLTGSLQARINSLRIGSKGSALNVRESFPIEHLLEGNTIIEIEDIGDDDVKAFIISLLMIRILEYRRQQTDYQQEVRHLLFIEEAHRLLKNVQSGTGENADPRGAAVEFFCNMLAEMRSKGQGFVVADQIPTKLAPDLIKNTNLKIVHRTVAGDERELMGKAMNMTEDQIAAFSTFKQGEAAVYSEGDIRPKLVKPSHADEFMLETRRSFSREAVLMHTAQNCIDINGKREYEMLTDKRSAICRACNICCTRLPEDILSYKSVSDNFMRLANILSPAAKGSCKVSEIDNALRQFTDMYVPEDFSFQKTAKNCLLVCLIKQWGLEKNDPVLKKKLEKIYINENIKKHSASPPLPPILGAKRCFLL